MSRTISVWAYQSKWSMFTINIYLRFALIALFLGGGIVLAALYSFWYALPLILIGLALLIGYFLLGTIQSAATILQAGKMAEAEKRLNLTFFPALLYSANKAYYYMLRAGIAQHKQQNQEAERFLQLAREVKVPTDNERAVIHLQLANIAMQRNNWAQAKAYFKVAKNCKVTEPAIKEQIREFEKALKNSGVLKPGMRGQRMQPGGKRRRPKIR